MHLVLYTAGGKDNVGRLRLGDTAPVARIKEQVTWPRQRLEREKTTVNMI